MIVWLEIPTELLGCNKLKYNENLMVSDVFCHKSLMYNNNQNGSQQFSGQSVSVRLIINLFHCSIWLKCIYFFVFSNSDLLVAYPNLMWSDPASKEATVHFASLQLLFLSSVASTAPLWLSSLLRQSTPPLNCFNRKNLTPLNLI